jgi:predicted GNAT family acetyltransferase
VEAPSISSMRVLEPDDSAALEAFLIPRIESSMFLLGNMRAAGLIDKGQPYGGTYAAAFEGDEITGVVAHYWNGYLVLQAQVCLPELCSLAVETSGRRIMGLIGPSEQVEVARLDVDIDGTTIRMADVHRLYSLALQDLIVPKKLASGEVVGRHIEPRDLDLLTDWREAYSIEALGEEPGPGLRRECRSSTERLLEEGRCWILEENERPVAYSGFNTATTEAVQIGGVWTPPELRSRGYGRSVVAASLLDARAEGVTTGVLFTGSDNVPAQRAYEALGFRHIGAYGLVLLS